MRYASLLFSCLLAACGGRVDGPEGGATPPATSTPPATDAPSPPPRAASPPTTPTVAGNISLLSVGGQLAASALFPLAGAPAEPLGPDCILRTANGSAPDSVSAGDIVVDFGSGGRSLTLSYDAGKRAYEDASFDGIVPAGSPIAIHAAGSATVPAFDVTAATAAEAQLVQPSEGAPIVRDAADLDVAWTPMKEPLLVVSLQVAATTISCRFEAPLGHGVVPGALIRQAIKASDNTACVGACASLTVFTGHTTKVTAGAYEVFVTNGASVSRALTLVK